MFVFIFIILFDFVFFNVLWTHADDEHTECVARQCMFCPKFAEQVGDDADEDGDEDTDGDGDSEEGNGMHEMNARAVREPNIGSRRSRRAAASSRVEGGRSSLKATRKAMRKGSGKLKRGKWWATSAYVSPKLQLPYPNSDEVRSLLKEVMMRRIVAVAPMLVGGQSTVPNEEFHGLVNRYIVKGRRLGYRSILIGSARAVLHWNEGEARAKRLLMEQLGLRVPVVSRVLLARRERNRRRNAARKKQPEVVKAVEEKRRLQQLQRAQGEEHYKAGAFLMDDAGRGMDRAAEDRALDDEDRALVTTITQSDGDGDVEDDVSSFFSDMEAAEALEHKK